MEQSDNIAFYNRYSQNIDYEKIYGKKAIEFVYENKIGQMLLPIVTSSTVSKVYGHLQNTKYSAKKVPEFIKSYNIQINEFEKGSNRLKPIEESYINFNEFFIRKYKKGLRSFPEVSDELGAPAEGRYFGYSKVDANTKIPVKGKFLSVQNLLLDERFFEPFIDGPLVISRLCPVDYHRYHYPDDGSTVDSYTIPGELHSVNPMALSFKEDIFIKNERRVSILETKNFGTMAYIEVGATCVGKIVQSHDEDIEFIRGQEKGYFLFGGSTVIILGEKGRWAPSSDILNNTQNGIETYIRLGDKIN